MRILIVEDEPDIADLLRQGLEEARYTVDVAADGQTGFDRALIGEYSLIILDLMLPKMDGLRVCSELRSRRIKTPILMLTARDAVPDRVKGLETGADDYLSKPFDYDELIARVRALLRRDKVNRAGTIRIADLEIDTSACIVRRAGQEIALSRREYTLLEALAANEGQVLSRQTIQERVWLDDLSVSNTVDVYIGFLRKKIDANSEIKLIQTVHGLGYALRRPN